MTHKPLLAIHHKVALSVGGIVRYRIKVHPTQVHNIKTLQFRVHNSSPVYRNITPGSGPWKISIALVRNPDKTPVVPELVPSIGCAQVSRLDAYVNHDETNNDEGNNEWELEILSEMVLQPNWIDIKVEVFVVPRESTPDLNDSAADSNSSNSLASGTDEEVRPHLLLPNILSCEYKDTAAICGPTFPKADNRANKDEAQDNDDGLHLVILTHGVHGAWLDMLYIKEQIDAQNAKHGKTVTFLTDTNHAGTEEGIQMAGRRAALDILEFTGYCDTEHGQELYRSLSTVAKNKSLSKSKPTAGSGTEAPAATTSSNDVTKGEFFKTLQPVHFITLATPMLGVGFEHPWVLGFALARGVLGQTGKDLALEDRSSKHKRSASSTSSSSSSSSKHTKDGTSSEIATAAHTASSTAALDKSTTSPPECALDHGPGPLLLAMARPGSVSHRVLKQFKDRTSYANIENDMAVRFETSTMMGIPTFDINQFFSPEGGAPTSRKSFYQSALTSTMALLFPNVPTKAKFLSIADAPSPIVVVSHVEAVGETAGKDGSEEPAPASEGRGNTGIEDGKDSQHGQHSKDKKRRSHPKWPAVDGSTKSPSSSSSSLPSILGSSSTKAAAATAISKSRLDLAHLVAEGYHTDMDWTKIGVFIEHEAHVQIIVRRKWYNLEGWKCVQDLVERFDFT
ncbi:putative serine esterase-domain-containing protein [Gamsiella multidivaricata]|uniref:putative serine esterase-domain-containing protein n=1 Tax=Gamsiella multidivaricata TaxID=101098 RepID=UPI00221E5FE9|nr:putative serine esterase-domain-containing protein [Gamsiella multidivaricata]KAI7830425.1 putative serine esterase-domain-containing protein [Gamsiella multidivaricata]